MRTYQSISVGDVYTVIPTLDTNAYAIGDYLAKAEIVDVFKKSGDGEKIKLESIDLTDLAKQNIEYDLLFFDQDPTVASAVNAPIDITDTEMAKKIGSLSIKNCGTGSYVNTASNSSLTMSQINLWLRRKEKTGDIGAQVILSRSIFVVIVAKGAGTFLANSLVFKFGFAS